MNLNIKIKNYRCYPETHPVEFELKDGFTSLMGINNSGKSTLIRFFYEFRELFRVIRLPTQTSAGAMHAGTPAEFSWPQEVTDDDDVYSKTTHGNLTIDISFSIGDRPLVDNYPLVNRILISVPRGGRKFSYKLFTDFEEVKLQGARKQQIQRNLLMNIIHKNPNTTCVDISLLNDALDTLINVLYVGAFRNALNVSIDSGQYYDLDIGRQIINSWKNKKTGSSSSDNEDAYRLIDQIKKIFNFSDLDINASADERTLQIFLDGKSYKLSELGSGISQFFVVLANAINKKPSFILIDEPELNLHPSLQLDFLTTLGSYSKNGVVFSTHSYGLSRAGADSIYTVVQQSPGISSIKLLESTPRLSELLGELSYSGYRELGYETALFVEGPTEIKTIQQFLRLYGVDHKILLLPLGGSQFIRGNIEDQLIELKRISDFVHILIDSEKSSETEALDKKRQKFVDSCENVGISCHVLNLRATENYFSDSAIKSALGSKYGALQPYQKLSDVEHGWNKANNWRIAREMKKEEIAVTDLGQFIENISS